LVILLIILLRKIPPTFIIKTDTAGTLLWAKTIPSNSGENVGTGIIGDDRGNIFIAGNMVGSTDFSGSVQNAASRQDYLAKMSATRGNLARGMVFLDKNLNGQIDSSEQGMEEVFIETASGSNMTGPDGTFSLLLPPGNHTLFPAPKRYYRYVPATLQTTFNKTNQETGNLNFALQAIPNQTDVSINITSQAAARPGFSFSYFLTLENVGTSPVSDTVALKYNPAVLTYDSSSQLPVVQNNGALKWAYANLLPNEKRTIKINYTVSVSAALNTILSASTIIGPLKPDLYTANNFDSTNIAVTGSYDPNDKQVDKSTLAREVALRGEYLDYTIRFQNTGTDTAFTIIITDVITSDLQLSSFKMLAASHAYKVNLKNGNMLEWRFDNILLPDSNRNEPASHGFVRFRIKTKPGLLPGDSITNQAAIYFDFNAPIITNIAKTKIISPSIENNASTNKLTFKLYPNPAKNYVMVQAEFKKNIPATVSLVNVLGQTLSKVTLPANNQVHYQLPLKELPKGIYLIRLETEIGMQTQRLVVQ
jgi:uncharacterized repeat protein (TIGR01451 family)